MSRVFLFDIGKVIVDFDFRVSAQKIAEHCDLPAEEVFASVIPLLSAVECGLISSEVFLDQAIALTGFRGEREYFLDALREVLSPNQPMVDFIEDQHAAGAHLYLLSNTSDIHVPYLFERFPVFHLFHGAVYSHEAGCMKPSPEIYEKTARKLGLIPRETIYIDDSRENAAAGARHGFRSLVYDLKDHQKFLREMEELT